MAGPTGIRSRADRAALALCALLAACGEQRGRVPPSVVGPSPPLDADPVEQEASPLVPERSSADGGALSRRDAAPGSEQGCVALRFPITFVSTRAPPANAYELYVMTEDGSEVRRIGRGPHFTNPVWAPDGASIAFHHLSQTRESYIGVIDPDGAIGVQLSALVPYLPVNDVRGLPDGPTWSSDGETLAFATPDAAGSYRIQLIARSGGQQRALLPDLTASHAHPRFAHEDTRLVYVADSERGADLWLVDVAEPARRQNLTHGRLARVEWPRWSPDDARIAFTALDPEPPDAGGGDTEVFVLALASGAITQVTHNSDDERQPTWSPDAERLLYVSERDCPAVDDCSDLYLARVDGAEPERQLTTTAREHFPDWYGGATCSGKR
jgi:Tol biopolymer transport system component